jgi:hypothetical protein
MPLVRVLSHSFKCKCYVCCDTSLPEEVASQQGAGARAATTLKRRTKLTQGSTRCRRPMKVVDDYGHFPTYCVFACVCVCVCACVCVF